MVLWLTSHAAPQGLPDVKQTAIEHFLRWCIRTKPIISNRNSPPSPRVRTINERPPSPLRPGGWWRGCFYCLPVTDFYRWLGIRVLGKFGTARHVNNYLRVLLPGMFVNLAAFGTKCETMAWFLQRPSECQTADCEDGFAPMQTNAPTTHQHPPRTELRTPREHHTEGAT